MKSLRPKSHQLQSAFAGFTEQAVMGFKLLEEQAGDGWYVNNTLSQADINGVVCYQAASQFVLPDHVSAEKFPRLAALCERAMKIDAFASTVPHSESPVYLFEKDAEPRAPYRQSTLTIGCRLNGDIEGASICAAWAVLASWGATSCFTRRLARRPLSRSISRSPFHLRCALTSEALRAPNYYGRHLETKTAR